MSVNGVCIDGPLKIECYKQSIRNGHDLFVVRNIERIPYIAPKPRDVIAVTPYIARPIEAVKKTKRKSWSRLFEMSEEWKLLRSSVLLMYGKTCMRCGSTKNIQVDHIKPKYKYPHLSLDVNNLQVLCWPCNKSKSTIDETDYRNK